MMPTEAITAAGTVKLLIDLATLAVDLPRWAKPVLALVGGIVIVLLLQLAGGQRVSAQQLADAILSGITAGAMAIGITAAQTKATAVKAARKTGA